MRLTAANACPRAQRAGGRDTGLGDGKRVWGNSRERLELGALEAWRQGLLELVRLVGVLNRERVQVLQQRRGAGRKCACGCRVNPCEGDSRTLLQRILNFVTFEVLFAVLTLLTMIFTLRASFLRAVWRKSRISLISLGLQNRRETTRWAPQTTTSHDQEPRRKCAARLKEGLTF